MKRRVFTGAARGCRAWLVYGIVEFILACGIPLVFEPDTTLLPWQWNLIGYLFAVYALCGLLLGAASGALLSLAGRDRDADYRQYETAAGLTVGAAFVLNLVPAFPLARSEYIALAIAVALSISFAAALIWKPWLPRIDFLANPWALALLLLLGPWISRDALGNRSAFAKTAVALAAIGLIVILARYWRRLSPPRMAPSRRQAITAGASLALLAWIAASGIGSSANASPAASGKCNIVLITMDTVRADHLSVYGYERDTTPHLRDFAGEATLYRQAIAASDQTLTTHASIFTGLYPRWHGAYYAPPEYPYGRPLASRHLTLAEVLRSRGYGTAAEVANYGKLQPSLGLSRGFGVYDVRRAIRLSPSQGPVSDRPFYLREGARRLLNVAGVDTSAFDAIALRAADINRRAFAWLDRNRNRPFFLFINYMDAHMPYVPAPPFNSRFPGRNPRFQTTDFWNVYRSVNSGQRAISPAERAHLVSQYDGGIASMDAGIADLLARLRELGLYRNTLIVVTADHGEAFGDRNLVEHALGSVYQEHVHVPLLIKYPGESHAETSDALVSQVDLMPTILDLAGCPLPPGVQGHSLRSQNASSVVFSEAIPLIYLPAWNARFRTARRAAIAGAWKLIKADSGMTELYNMADDPRETHNLYGAGDPNAAALEARLAAWTASFPQPLEQPRKLDKGSVDRLKSLGYVQ